MKTSRKNFIQGFLVGVFTTGIGKFLGRKNQKENRQDKFGLYYDVLNKWMLLKENNKTIAECLRKRGIKTIAIYGMGDLGKHLKKDIEGTEIEIRYAIDRSLFAVIDIDVYEPESTLPPVDAIIVTPVHDFENIYKALKQKTNYEIISISEVVKEGITYD